MALAFSKVKIYTAYVDDMAIIIIQEYTDVDNPPLDVLTGITRITNEGRASKVSVPYTSTSNYPRVDYKTVWQPIGQEGWTEKIQSTLLYKKVGNTYINQIDNWLSVDTGQILRVRSNNCNNYGIPDPNLPAYKRLPNNSLWNVDKITITSRRGTPEIADMELTLVRNWFEEGIKK